MPWETDGPVESTSEQRFERGRLWSVRRIGVVGGALVAIGTMLPWLRYTADDFYADEFQAAGLPLSGSVNGVALDVGILVLLLGGFVAVGAYRSRGTGGWASLIGIASGAILALTVPILLDPGAFQPGIADATRAAFESFAAGIGLYLSILGGLVSAGTSILLGQASR